jgi:hypothetical protein
MDAAVVVALISGVVAIASATVGWRASNRATSAQQQIGERAADAARTRQLREDLEAADVQVRTLRRQVEVLTREAEAMAADLAYLRRSIWRPGMTVERLRQLVGPEAPASDNGHAE